MIRTSRAEHITESKDSGWRFLVSFPFVRLAGFAGAMEPDPPAQAVLTDHRRERMTDLSPSRSMALSPLVKVHRRIDVIPALGCDRYQLLTGKQFWDGGSKLRRRNRVRSASSLRTKRNQARYHLNKQKKGVGPNNRSNKWPKPRHGAPVAPVFCHLNKNLDYFQDT